MADIQTIDEMREAYRGEWAFLADCEDDGSGRLVRGKVVAHSADRDDVYRVMANYGETADHSGEGGGYFTVRYLGEIPAINYML